MANTLDLDPEWGAIDLVEDIEEAFGVEIANDEAERVVTVGDLYHILRARLPDWNDVGGSCSSSFVFYRLRRSIAPEDRCGVRPGTELTGIGLPPARLFRKLGKKTGLRLPIHGQTWLGVAGGWLLLAGGTVAIVAFLARLWIPSAAAALLSLAGFVLLWIDPGRLPAGMVTLGDLVRRTVPLNSQTLRQAGGRPPHLWSALVALAAEHGMLRQEEIGPETTLHPPQRGAVTGAPR